MAVSGHKHFRKGEDRSGLVFHQTPSLSGHERWYERAGYVGSKRGTRVHLLSPTKGEIATLTHYA